MSSRAIVGLTLAIVCSSACGQEDPAPAPAVAVAEPVEGDPLLARARASVLRGRLDADVKREILESDDPAHARARRLLEAMERADAPPSEPGDSIAVVAPPLGETEVPPIVAVTPVPEAGAVTPRVPAPPRPVLRKMSLKQHKGGVTLTLNASEGVLVGVASQPNSGTLRLVVDSAEAAAGVLRARPRAGGVRVTSVTPATKSVIITLQLPRGWRHAGTQRFGGGARVRLVGPG